MGESTDVFVIGGGPAGLAAAIAARNQGLDVFVADGAQPPIDKACGEGLMPDTISALRALGVAINPAEGFAFRGIRFIGDTGRVDASFPSGQGIGLRRLLLHEKMIDRAKRLGVNLLWNTPVTGIASEGVVMGNKKIAARWIVGADGVRSRVRRWAGLESSRQSRPRFAFRRHYRVRPWSDCIEIYWGRHAQAYVTPVSDRDVCVVLISREPGLRFTSLSTEFPELARRLPSASVNKERGELTLTQFQDTVCRGRVALIGDASGTVDAVTGEGLCLSFHQAAGLAAALASGDLRLYQAAHRRIARRPTWMSRLLLLLDSHDGLRERTLRSLSKHPELFAQLLAAHVGVTSPRHIVATGASLGWRFVTA